MRAMVQLVEADLPAEGIAVHAEQARRPRLISFGTVQDALDKSLLKLVDGFVKQDPALDHLSNQNFQLIFHSRTLRKRFGNFWPGLGQFVSGQQSIRFPILGLCRGYHVSG